MAERGETSIESSASDDGGDLARAAVARAQRPRPDHHASGGTEKGDNTHPRPARRRSTRRLGPPTDAERIEAFEEATFKACECLPMEVRLHILGFVGNQPEGVYVDRTFLPKTPHFAKQYLARQVLLGEKGEAHMLRGQTVILPARLGYLPGDVGPPAPDGSLLLDASTVPPARRGLITTIHLTNLELESFKRDGMNFIRERIPSYSSLTRPPGTEVEKMRLPVLDVDQLNLFRNIRFVYVDALAPRLNTASAWHLAKALGQGGDQDGDQGQDQDQDLARGLRLGSLAFPFTLIVNLNDWLHDERKERGSEDSGQLRQDKEDLSASFKEDDGVMDIFREAFEVGKSVKLEIEASDEWLGPQVALRYSTPPGGQGLHTAAARADTLARYWLGAVRRTTKPYGRAGRTYLRAGTSTLNS